MNTMTQPAQAKAGIITEAMRRVAELEQLPAEKIREGVAAGTIVIPRTSTIRISIRSESAGC